MLNNLKIILCEIAIFIVLSLLIFIKGSVLYSLDIPFIEWSSLSQVCQYCFDLNIALVIALLISLICNESFQYKGRSLKRIAKNSAILIIVNSIIILLSPIVGFLGIVIVAPALTGNIIKIISISKHILNAL